MNAKRIAADAVSDAFELFCRPQVNALLLKQPFTLPSRSELEAMCDGSGRSVYFVQTQGLLKIGVASDVADRLSTLQVGCPYELEFLGSIGGGPSAERALHLALDCYRFRGEWFMQPPGVRQAIRDLLNQGTAR